MTSPTPHRQAREVGAAVGRAHQQDTGLKTEPGGVVIPSGESAPLPDWRQDTHRPPLDPTPIYDQLRDEFAAAERARHPLVSGTGDGRARDGQGRFAPSHDREDGA